ncbi:hypothetical protein FKM82_023998 [Ascaphus truei]
MLRVLAENVDCYEESLKQIFHEGGNQKIIFPRFINISRFGRKSGATASRKDPGSFRFVRENFIPTSHTHKEPGYTSVSPSTRFTLWNSASSLISV